jgi:hypothetical protein
MKIHLHDLPLEATAHSFNSFVESETLTAGGAKNSTTY